MSIAATTGTNGAQPGTLSRAQPSDPSSADQQRLRELKQSDQRVRQHELAHQSAGGRFAGPANYQTVVGPDGRAYAVGGEVRIDVAAVRGDPQATADKMRTVIAAALAPADPSSQDRAVAARAAVRLQEALVEVAAESGKPEGYRKDAPPGSQLDVVA